MIGANGELTYSDVDLDTIAQAQFLHLGGTPSLLKLDNGLNRPAAFWAYAKESGATTMNWTLIFS